MAVFPCAMLGQVDSQHLPTCFTGCSGKTFCLFLAAVLAMEIEVNIPAPVAVQNGRDARKSHDLFFIRDSPYPIMLSIRRDVLFTLRIAFRPPFFPFSL